jgi:tripartite ATP-independent transporter DctM subunit
VSPELITVGIFGTLIVFLATGFPVGFCLMGVSLIWLLVLHGPGILQLVPATIFDTGTTEIFLAAPLFIFMAITLERTGIGTLLYDAMHQWTSGVAGGLAAGTVASAALIDAMTGIGGTAVLVLGVLAIPEMIRRGYHPYVAIGPMPPSGALGVLIPPTVIGVLLGGFAGIPAGHLFFGAAVPGVLCATLFCIFIVIRCWFKPALAPPIPKEERPSWNDRFRATSKVFLPVLLVVIVLGSIWYGIATPSEAAGIGALGTLLIGLFRRQFSVPILKNVLSLSAQVSVMVLTLLTGGALFARLLQLSGSANLVAQMVINVDAGVVGTLLIFVGIATILGMFIDGAAIIFIVTPFMMAVVRTLGIDQVWFGVILMISVAAGYVTPPFGMNLFYLRGIVDQAQTSPGCDSLKQLTIRDIWLAVLPYVVLMYVALGLVLLFPELATWLPSKMR